MIHVFYLKINIIEIQVIKLLNVGLLHALKKIDKLSQSGHKGAKDLATYWVGQGVGLMDQPMSAGAVVQDFKKDFAEAYERLNHFFE